MTYCGTLKHPEPSSHAYTWVSFQSCEKGSFFWFQWKVRRSNMCPRLGVLSSPKDVSIVSWRTTWERNTHHEKPVSHSTVFAYTERHWLIWEIILAFIKPRNISAWCMWDYSLSLMFLQLNQKRKVGYRRYNIIYPYSSSFFNGTLNFVVYDAQKSLLLLMCSMVKCEWSKLEMRCIFLQQQHQQSQCYATHHMTSFIPFQNPKSFTRVRVQYFWKHIFWKLFA